MDAAPVAAQDAPASLYRRPAYRWYVLAILTLTFAAHAMDRNLPSILIEPVRHEFHLTDAELGLFTGSGYGLAFAITVLPLGYLSDRMNRKVLLSILLLLWSGFTTLGGVTRNYTQLIATRLAVGAAESGGAPIILPMVSDIFATNRRSFAIGVLYVGGALGGVLAAALGGYIAATHGWRAAAFLAGLPGLLLAVLTLTTVQDPPRGYADKIAETGPPARFTEMLRFLLGQPGLICIILAGALIGLTTISLSAWSSSFFVRVHGLDLKQVGVIIAFGGFCWLASPPLWGLLADKLAKRDSTWPITITWTAGLVSVAAGLVWLFSPSLPVVIGAFYLGDFIRIGYATLLYPVVMAHTPPKMRGGVFAIIQFITNLFGFGLGPVFIGFLSDLYGGNGGLRYSMADALGLYVLVTALLIAATMLLRNRPTLSDRAAGA